jgi:subtilisin family serine protease
MSLCTRALTRALAAMTAVVVTWSLIGATDSPAAASAVDHGRPDGRAAGKLIPGQYMVTLEPSADVSAVLDSLDVRPIHTYASVFKGFTAKLTSTQVNRIRTLRTLATVEQDAVVETAASAWTPGQTSGPRAAPSRHRRAAPSWGLDRIDQRSLPLDHSINTAFDGKGVTAYVIDTGIDTTHPEFEGRAKAGYDVINDGRSGRDCNGHGTHVAGIVGGATRGVAPEVSLVSVRTLDCGGKGTWSGQVKALDWLMSNAAKPAVANLSLGGAPGSATVDKAANALADKGVFLVAAAGNDSEDACDYTPARAENVLAVGATTITDGFAPFSNHGRCVGVLAPGTGISSAKLGGGYAAKNGTSMAAPHVTGVAALFKQAMGDQSAGTVKTWLVHGATHNAIKNTPANTPNKLLNTTGL